ncbi:MAG: hypothetical protein HOG89_00835 [Candidatus Peribacter sp.]|jgi:hypothetical protein|nr:hypothetical protein [Candidatus Peribacter sp.]MBT4392933.1 hypothetical protein [Candidatus Peribacter sp.]MBT4600993.1 hypothetical protein [Candidatus Peribacter sp.]MBT5149035.1 hypothetical protein [Candidatus Peribacter sp.]MBT5637359.1 hypothetical protein [Candidatus Peribacter sp.]
MSLKKLTVLGIVLSTCLYVAWLAFPITIISADIGRHLADGKIFFGNPEWRSALLSTNFYSLAVPDFAIINHHWAAGLLFWIIKSIAGWKGLHIFQIVLGLASLGFIVDIARKKSTTRIALLVTLCVLPLVAYRHEVRPEYLGYLSLGVIYWLLENKQSKHLWWIPLIIIGWVNVHASFPLGVGLLFLFTFDAFLRKSAQRMLLLKVSVVSVVCTVINPAFISGALYPLSILSDPGYAVFENQSIKFLGTIGVSNWTFTFVKISTVLALLSAGILAYTKQLKNNRPQLMIAALSIMMAWLSVRHISVMGFMLIPVFAIALSQVKWPISRKWITILATTVFIVVAGLQVNHLKSRWIVLGLEPKANDAAEFMKDHEIGGPFFNNFDIGGYMIYHFFPEHKPFIYNRPESHPSDFWRTTYIPMMQDRKIWKQQLDEHQFNAIVLYYGDRTSWAQDFLKSTIQDFEWAAVFVDKSVIVFVRRNSDNEKLIQQFEIPTHKLIKS